MNFIDTLEKKGLFVFTRISAIIIIIILIFTAIIGIIILYGTYIAYSSHVDPHEIINRIKITEIDKNQNIQPQTSHPAVIETDLLPGIKLPFVLQRYFSDQNNRNVLLRQLDNIPEKNRQEYLNNMAEVVLLAEKEEQFDIIKTINTYIEIKNKKYNEIEKKKANDISMRYYFIGAIAITLVIIALFSLILVMLAIERNTRTHE